MRVATIGTALALALTGTVAAAQDYEITSTGTGVQSIRYRITSTLPARIEVPAAAPVQAHQFLGYGPDMFCHTAAESELSPFDFVNRLTYTVNGRTAAQLRELVKSVDARSERVGKYSLLFQWNEESSGAFNNRPSSTAPIALPWSLVTAQQRGEPITIPLQTCLSAAQLDAAIAEGRRLVLLVIQAMEGKPSLLQPGQQSVPGGATLRR